MELHQFRYFVAVADAGNFTRAAEHCQIAQPSLSQQIAKLEQELGQPLFERLGRKIRLTDAGKSLYHRAVAILDAVEEAREEITGNARSGRGTLSIGAIPTVGPYLLPMLLKRFVSKFPEATVTVHEDFTDRIVRGCLIGDLDVAIVALPIDEDQLLVEPLFREELMLALPARHPLTRRRRITLKDISHEPFILLHETHCLGQQIVSFCQQSECQPVAVCRSAQLMTVQELVALGQGVSLIPMMALKADKSHRCIYRSLADRRPTRTIAMIRHKARHQTFLAAQFCDLLQKMELSKSIGD